MLHKLPCQTRIPQHPHQHLQTGHDLSHFSMNAEDWELVPVLFLVFSSGWAGKGVRAAEVGAAETQGHRPERIVLGFFNPLWLQQKLWYKKRFNHKGKMADWRNHSFFFNLHPTDMTQGALRDIQKRVETSKNLNSLKLSLCFLPFM